MNEIINKLILHQIYLNRVENGIVKKCLKEIENANKLILTELRKSHSITTKERYRKIAIYLKDVSKELKSKLVKSMNYEDFIDYEINALINIFDKYEGIEFLIPSKEQIISAATFKPYLPNTTFENYLDRLKDDFFNTWDSAVRSGYLTGMTTEKIVKDVMGTIAKNADVTKYGTIQNLRNSVEKNTRTALQSFASEARKIIYEKNEKIIDGYKWIATLDTRTCLVCGNMESKTYKTMADIKNQPPIHFNCRCTIVPIINGFDELKEGETRSSMNGQIDGKITFNEWLNEQSEDIQKDILGEERFKLYKKGMEIKDFIADNKIIELSKIKS